MTDQAIVIDTPEGISTWVFLSRMHQLALELNTGMHHSRGPILHSMYREGLIDTDLRGTKKNKQMVLQAMVDFCNQNLTDWSPSNSVKKALAR